MLSTSIPIGAVVSLVAEYAGPVIKEIGGDRLLEELRNSLVSKAVSGFIDDVTSTGLESELKRATAGAVRKWLRDRSPLEQRNPELLGGILKELEGALDDGRPLSEDAEGFIDCFNKALSSRSKAREYIQLKVDIATYQNSAETRQDASEIKEMIKALYEKIDRLVSGAGGVTLSAHNLTPSAVCRPSGCFIGREKELSELKRLVAGKGKVVITGMGGLGKTELARKLFDEMEKDYDEVAWLTYRGSAKETILNGLDIFPEIKDPEERWRSICSMLANDGRLRLMMLDNADYDVTMHQDPLQDRSLKVLSGFSDVDIVMTSRCSEVMGDYRMYTLRELEDEECADIFRAYYSGTPSEDDTPVIREIAGMAFNNTQVVEMFARQAKYEDLRRYRDKLRKGYDAVNLKIQQGDRRDTVPALMGYMFETSVTEHRDILYGFAGLPQTSAFSMGELEEWFGHDPSGVDRLASTGWLRFEGGRFSMHPLIREVVTRHSRDDGYVRDISFFRNYLESSHESFLSRDIRYDALSMRVEVVESFGGPVDGPDFPFSPDVLDSLGHAHSALWHPDMAMKAYTKALNLREESSAPEKDIASSYSNMATVYLSLGGQENLERALELNSKAIDIEERILSPDSLNLGKSYNNMALVYMDLGGQENLERALEYNGKAMDIYERVLAPDSHDLATSYSNRAQVYLSLGGQENLERALEFNGKAIDIQESILSPDNPALATSYNNMALVYQSLGGQENLEFALELNRKAIDINEKILPDSPALATSYNNMALVYMSLGGQENLERALELNSKAIDIEERILSPDSLNLGKSYNNMALVYMDLGGQENLERALEYNGKAMDIYERVLAPDSHDLATSYSNRAQVYLSLGGQENLERALEFNGKAIDIQESILSPDNPALATSYNNMALVYQSLGGQENLEFALELNRKAIDIFERVLSPDSPDLATSYNNMALVYMSLGGQENLERALELNSKAIDIEERILSPDSPALARSYSNMATVYYILGGQENLERALEYNGKAVDIYERVLSPDSPDLATSYGNMATIYQDLGGKENLKEALKFVDKAISIIETAFPSDSNRVEGYYTLRNGVLKQLGERKHASPQFFGKLIQQLFGAIKDLLKNKPC